MSLVDTTASAMYRATFLLLGLAVIHSTFAISFFQVPPPELGDDEVLDQNVVYTVGQAVTFRWSTDHSRTDLRLKNYTHDIVRTFLRNSAAESFDWEVSFPSSTDASMPTFYLALYEPGNSNWFVTSHYFNITGHEATTSSTLTSSTAAATSTISSQTSIPTANNSPEETSSSNQQAKGLSRGGVAGIAIATTLAVVAALGGVGYFLWRRRSRTKASGGNDNVGGTSEPDHQSQQPYTAEWKPVPQSEPAELDTKAGRTSEPVELDTKAVRTPEPVELSAEGR